MTKPGEIAEAYEEISKFVEKKLKGFDYNMIIAISKIHKDRNEVESMGFTFSTIGRFTPFLVVKSIIANSISQFRNLMEEYRVEPAQPIIRPTEEGED